jgi:hypothetical protein
LTLSAKAISSAGVEMDTVSANAENTKLSETSKVKNLYFIVSFYYFSLFPLLLYAVPTAKI